MLLLPLHNGTSSVQLSQHRFEWQSCGFLWETELVQNEILFSSLHDSVSTDMYLADTVLSSVNITHGRDMVDTHGAAGLVVRTDHTSIF